MRRADAEAKAMAIGNITDVLRLKTVSPLQNVYAVRRVKTAMYCPRVWDCSKQNGKIVYAWNCMHHFSMFR